MTHHHKLLKLEEANEKVRLLVKVFGLEADTQATQPTFTDKHKDTQRQPAPQVKQLNIFEW